MADEEILKYLKEALKFRGQVQAVLFLFTSPGQKSSDAALTILCDWVEAQDWSGLTDSGSNAVRACLAQVRPAVAAVEVPK